MTACKEVKSRKYQTRKAPAYHAKDCRGKTLPGKDGPYVSKPDARGVYKWVRTQKRRGKHYDTHNNGSRPFRVYVDGTSVEVLRDTRTSLGQEATYTDTVLKQRVQRVHVGRSRKPPTFIGNTVLLHVAGPRYIFIGTEIYAFELCDGDSFDRYYSPVGNSDVPYPVLLGKQNVYFMLDRTYVPRVLFGHSPRLDWENAYSYYYGWVDLDGKSTKGDRRNALEHDAKPMKHVVVKVPVSP